MKIKISKIKIGKRLRTESGDLDELAESIKVYGLLSPIIIKPIPNSSKHTHKLLAGWRRINACKILQLESIESIIKKHE